MGNPSLINGAQTRQPRKSTPKTAQPQGRLIDPLEAQHGTLRHVLREGDGDKIRDLKRSIEPEHFQDPNARIIAEVIWKQFEDGASIDSDSIADLLLERGNERAYAALIELLPPPKREPSWKDCLQAVLNWKLALPAAPESATFPLNEIGNGQRFAAMHGERLRFVSVWDKWAIYEGGRWQPDEQGQAEQLAKLVEASITAEATHESDDDRRGRLLKHASTLTKLATRQKMLKDASTEPHMSIRPEQFDTKPHLFNVANGTLDLLTLRLHPHRAGDLLTHQTPALYDAAADCPTWRKCMARWIPDEATRDHVQEMAGVSLSGTVFDEFFVFLYGDGDNGKSTFLRVLEWLAGSYSHKTQAETIMQARDARNANAPAPELLALKGARLVTVHEIDSKHTLNATLIKDLTGRDAITARGLFEKRPTTFEPQFTLWMFGNGKPQIKDTSGGMWRRPRLIDFGQPIPAQERDPQLAEKLRSELSGILNWTLEGLERVKQRGLIVPDAVSRAVAEYRAEQDAMAAFIMDCCITGQQCSAAAGELWKAWGEWCRENGEKEGTQRAFGSELKRRKFESYRGSTGNRWRGIGLKAPENSPKPPPKGETATAPTAPTAPISDKVGKNNSHVEDFSGNHCITAVHAVMDDSIFDDE
jgi:putative DNA primase/helicase